MSCFGLRSANGRGETRCLAAREVSAALISWCSSQTRPDCSRGLCRWFAKEEMLDRGPCMAEMLFSTEGGLMPAHLLHFRCIKTRTKCDGVSSVYVPGSGDFGGALAFYRSLMYL
ncbi:hypothetical protein Nepgr_009360 [Nepenthes gracilis]|uniref:Uncharacterized protein n=1 Tax=Nepenthes gracilis TaxID=150966 RepID=A0AAD3SAG3_NEPGR|nr:hypothetical protein Nepgr_009360 [Nepenthes gracilis]